jgi:shikimate kinase
MNIVLIGFTSSGKSAAGSLLADTLGIPFVDLDRRVEELYHGRHGEPLTCRELYLRIGDAAFGLLEHEVILETTRLDRVVFSTGGKAPLRKGNADILRRWGRVVYLKTTPQVIFSRMMEKGPPVYLTDGFSLEAVIRHWNERSSYYEHMSDLIISNDWLSVDATVQLILEKLGLPAQQPI